MSDSSITEVTCAIEGADSLEETDIQEISYPIVSSAGNEKKSDPSSDDETESRTKDPEKPVESGVPIIVQCEDEAEVQPIGSSGMKGATAICSLDSSEFSQKEPSLDDDTESKTKEKPVESEVQIISRRQDESESPQNDSSEVKGAAAICSPDSSESTLTYPSPQRCPDLNVEVASSVRKMSLSPSQAPTEEAGATPTLDEDVAFVQLILFMSTAFSAQSKAASGSDLSTGVAQTMDSEKYGTEKDVATTAALLEPEPQPLKSIPLRNTKGERKGLTMSPKKVSETATSSTKSTKIPMSLDLPRVPSPRRRSGLNIAEAVAFLGVLRSLSPSDLVAFEQLVLLMTASTIRQSNATYGSDLFTRVAQAIDSEKDAAEKVVGSGTATSSSKITKKPMSLNLPHVPSSRRCAGLNREEAARFVGKMSLSPSEAPTEEARATRTPEENVALQQQNSLMAASTTGQSNMASGSDLSFSKGLITSPKKVSRTAISSTKSTKRPMSLNLPPVRSPKRHSRLNLAEAARFLESLRYLSPSEYVALKQLITIFAASTAGHSNAASRSDLSRGVAQTMDSEEIVATTAAIPKPEPQPRKSRQWRKTMGKCKNLTKSVKKVPGTATMSLNLPHVCLRLNLVEVARFIVETDSLSPSEAPTEEASVTRTHEENVASQQQTSLMAASPIGQSNAASGRDLSTGVAQTMDSEKDAAEKVVTTTAALPKPEP